jgi:hypothetical protein
MTTRQLQMLALLCALAAIGVGMLLVVVLLNGARLGD